MANFDWSPPNWNSWWQPKPKEPPKPSEEQVRQDFLQGGGLKTGTPEQLGKTFGSAQGLAGKSTEQNRTLTQLAMQGLVTQGFQMQADEQKGLDWAKQQMQQAWPELMKNPLTEADINSLGAGQLEEIARGKMRDMQSIREHLGVTGLDGPAAADLGIQAELSALGQITTARRGLRERVASTTAQHQMNMLNSIGVGKDVMSAVSSYGAQALGISAGYAGSMYAADKGYDAAKYAAKKQKEGGIFGGILGAVGGILSGGLF